MGRESFGFFRRRDSVTHVKRLRRGGTARALQLGGDRSGRNNRSAVGCIFVVTLGTDTRYSHVLATVRFACGNIASRYAAKCVGRVAKTARCVLGFVLTVPKACATVIFGVRFSFF